MTYDELNIAIDSLEQHLTAETKSLLAQLLLERGEKRRLAHNPEGALEDVRRAFALDPTLVNRLNYKS